ncbi:uncharacterized protein [Antedon mediterranea]|uniref:uncharacterized protein isoform X1 n=1 Tax=Antedon mediterranea TaxID=105859 RepID=UPI003AF8CCC9
MFGLCFTLLIVLPAVLADDPSCVSKPCVDDEYCCHWETCCKAENSSSQNGIMWVFLFVIIFSTSIVGVCVRLCCRMIPRMMDNNERVIVVQPSNPSTIGYNQFQNQPL